MNNNVKVSGRAAGKPPKFLNLLQIRLPVTGIASIAHRITGFLLFLAIPFLIYCLELSLDGPQGFQRVAKMFEQPLLLMFLMLLLWSLLHHFCAGIRYLLLDIDIGVNKPSARSSAWFVMILPIVTTLVLAALLLGRGS